MRVRVVRLPRPLPPRVAVPAARVRPAHYGTWGQRGVFWQEPVPKGHCRWCGDPFPPGGRRRSYCRNECREEMHLRIMWGHLRAKIIERDVVCQLCGGVSYEPNSHDVWTWNRYLAAPEGSKLYTLERLTHWDDDGPAIRLSLDWDVDHIKPCADGGTDDPRNLRLLCGRCHKRITSAWRRARAAA